MITREALIRIHTQRIVRAEAAGKNWRTTVMSKAIVGKMSRGVKP